jgi:hypothetical protein
MVVFGTPKYTLNFSIAPALGNFFPVSHDEIAVVDEPIAAPSSAALTPLFWRKAFILPATVLYKSDIKPPDYYLHFKFSPRILESKALALFL